jgi:hypothetical protein
LKENISSEDLQRTMGSVLYYLGDMFPDKCILEDREPVATFGIPGVEGTFALLPPKPIFIVMSIVVRADACLSTENIGGFSTNLLCSVYSTRWYLLSCKSLPQFQSITL